MCSSCDAKIMAAPHPPAQERLTAESFTLGRMRVMNAVRVLCRPLQQVLPRTGLNYAHCWTSTPIPENATEISWNEHVMISQYCCSQPLRAIYLDTPTDVVLFFAFLPFIKGTYLYSWA